jgi:hypothetical protein
LTVNDLDVTAKGKKDVSNFEPTARAGE